MKTTIELPDDLLAQVREVAREERTTMRELMIEGLRHTIERRQSTRRADFVFPTFAGNGLVDDLDESEIIDASYGLHR
ncbi:MAG: type II toxin-antitoxin system VapB family antitoxin [Marmoricola sp.]